MRYIVNGMSYREISELTSLIPQGDYLELYYFVLKTTPGLFRIHPPKKCRVKMNTNFLRKTVEFNYQTKAGNWSSIHSYATKNNAFYYKSLQEAEQAFKKEVEFAKQVFTNEINRANMALNELANY